jgi:hypothetical protein
MSFILKIVEGPNRGAEIALVEGVAVTLGKGDECDIVLADSTLPEEPLSIEATADVVTVNGEQLDQFAVKTLGATSFAVGPADAPWGELKWPEKGEASRRDAETAEAQGGNEETSRRDAEAQSAEAEEENLRDSASPREEKKRHGFLGCLAVVVLLVLLLGVLAWLFRATVRPYAEKVLAYARETLHFGGGAGGADVARPMTLSEVAANYGLELKETNGQAKLSGNLKTRAERLRATAEAYEARPGVDLDLSDDESFKAAADDALFTITEGAMKVVAATNRVLSIAGTSASPAALKRILESLSDDLPKLRDIDAAGVAYGMVPDNEESDSGNYEMPIDVVHAKRSALKSKVKEPSLPVCGILTAPYPCLVMRDGSRVLEGAALGGNVIVKIEADAVTVTNATGRFTWKP